MSMSFRSEFEVFKDIFRAAGKPIFKASMIVYSGIILENELRTSMERDVLPEPFDYVDHIGNLEEASYITAFAFLSIGLLKAAEPLIDKSTEIFKSGLKKTAIGAFAVSSAIQVATEALEIAPLYHNTGDALDAAYGSGWSAAVAFMGYRLATSTTRP